MTCSSSNYLRPPWFIRATASILIPLYLSLAFPVFPLLQAAANTSLVADDSEPLVRTPSHVQVKRAQPNSVHFLSGTPANPSAVNQSFTVPLIALGGAPSAAESQALSIAIARYEATKDSSRFSAITQFLEAYPKSTYQPVLELNLGLNYLSGAYFLKALKTFQSAWEHSKTLSNVSGRAIADRAFGELVNLNARLGRFDELEKLFAETQSRTFIGAATELVAGAHDGLLMMKNRPEDSFKCGPAALERILTSQNGTAASKAKVMAARSTQKGVNLAEVYKLSREAGMNMQIARRSPGAPLLYPAVIHWKIGHYAAMIKNEQDFVSFQDPTFGSPYTASPQAIDSEASGYFLVPAGQLPAGWQPVSEIEAATVWGTGQSALPDPNQTKENSKKIECEGNPHGMTLVNAHALVCSLNLTDIPVGYTPPVGPSVDFKAIYNQREASQPTIFNYSNLGPKWNSNWIGYISFIEVEYPINRDIAFFVYYPVVHLPGGGIESYLPDYLSPSSPLPIDRDSRCWMSKTSDDTWVRNAPDGSQMVFRIMPGVMVPGKMVADITVDHNFTGYFLSQEIDPAGNMVQLTYDNPTVNAAPAARLLTITDSLNQMTTLSYDLASDPLKITKVSDPFGRYATFDYDANLRLEKITDIIGITSQFGYQGTGDFIESLITPYGVSHFAFGQSAGNSGPDNARWLEMTDPLGGTERIEFPIRPFFVNGPAPAGMTVALDQPVGNGDPHNVTYFWDKRAYSSYAAQAAGAQGRSLAYQYHWLRTTGTVNAASGSLAAEKAPFESPVHYNYPGQPEPSFEGTVNAPSKIGRVLDDGSSQVTSCAYNFFGKLTQVIDPLGRETDYEYATNNIDLLRVKQKNGSGFDILAQFAWNGQHLPLTVTDAAGQTATYTYNSAGQVRTITNAKGETTTFWYHPTGQPTANETLTPAASGYLVKIDGPIAGSTTQFAYDGYGRPRTVTDSQGYVVTTDYDSFDRPTVVTYPDNTYQQLVYGKLDAIKSRDRLGRWTVNTYNALRQLIRTRDPLGRLTGYDWCGCGALNQIIDPNGNSTAWFYDSQGRVSSKNFVDGTNVSFQYENTTSRLKTVTDAKGQVAHYTYYQDNTLAAVTYTDTAGAPLVPATPGVTYGYDPFYLRLSSMTDGVGTTAYSYNPYATYVVGSPIPSSLGAGKLATVTGPLANSTIGYTYDELGRTLTRSINGSANSTTVHYDSLGRVDTTTNALGTFNLGYVGVTGRLDHVIYPNAQRTNYAFYGNTAPAGTGNGDQRLSQIQNLKSGGTNLSTFGYTYDVVGQIQTWSRQYDATAALTSGFKYDSAGQLLSASLPSSASVVKNYTYNYDLAGNRTQEQIDSGVTTSLHNNLNQLTNRAPGGTMEFSGTLSEPASVTLAGKAATVDGTNNWRGTAAVTTGGNTLPIVATDPNGNSTTKTISIVVTGGTARTLTYDLNGNLTNNGAGQTYAYDALNRLRTITQGTNVTEFVYNGVGQRVQEKLNGSLIKQWIWDGGAQPAEERDASNNVTKRFFKLGEQASGANYYFVKDHLGSIREMTDATGAVRARYEYDPYGRQTKVSGDLESDFGFTGFYRHQRSGLNLTLYRAYDPELGRWTSRDPLAEKAGLNLYAYVSNRPLDAIDPTGLIIRFSDDSITQSQKKALCDMINDLKKDSSFRTLWEALENSNKIITIVVTADLDFTGQFVPESENTGRIMFQPGLGFEQPDGSYVYPESIFAHEAQHAYDFIDRSIRTFNELVRTPVQGTNPTGAPNQAEANAMHLQNLVSGNLGLPAQNKYWGNDWKILPDVGPKKK